MNGENGKTLTDHCHVCGKELVTIALTIDSNELVMESCETCDVRRWQLAGELIDRTSAIAQVEESIGRRR